MLDRVADAVRVADPFERGPAARQGEIRLGGDRCGVLPSQRQASPALRRRLAQSRREGAAGFEIGNGEAGDAQRRGVEMIERRAQGRGGVGRVEHRGRPIGERHRPQPGDPPQRAGEVERQHAGEDRAVSAGAPHQQHRDLGPVAEVLRHREHEIRFREGARLDGAGNQVSPGRDGRVVEVSRPAQFRPPAPARGGARPALDHREGRGQSPLPSCSGPVPRRDRVRPRRSGGTRPVPAGQPPGIASGLPASAAASG